jgi:hypothetical protein
MYMADLSNNEMPLDDFNEMLAKLRQIRCMHWPRYAVYDKTSKTTIYLDRTRLEGFDHIVWKPNKYPKGVSYPQADIAPTDKISALAFALRVAREGRVMEYAPKDMTPRPALTIIQE